MAKTGYGKRSAPAQQPCSADDFTLPPARERYIAGFIDHLPDGAAMNVKCMAKQLPLYGQQAVGSALTALSVAGYLRRVRCLIGEGDQVRWVFRTFWSRTARDNEWWAAYLAAENTHGAVRTATAAAAPAPVPAAPAVPQQRTAAPPPEPTPDAPSPAYLALAQLGRTDPRLALSAADCQALEAQAAEWLARGVNTDYLTQALTAGLPAQVDSPVGFVRRRLNDKIPPALPAAPVPPPPGTPTRRVMMECTECGTPGRPEALPDGLCRACRRPKSAETPAAGAPPIQPDVRVHVSRLRDLLKAP